MASHHAPERSRGLGRNRLWTLFDVALIGLVATWFYLPFLESGLPSGDFGPTVMVAEVGNRLTPSPFEVHTWNPYLMCGRPTFAYPSVFRLLYLPLSGLEPIVRMKATLILFAALAGIGMYVLVRGSGGHRSSALLAGLVYPLSTSQIVRTAVYPHVQVPMFFALVPLLIAAVIRLRWHPRAVTLLAVAMAACLVRDVQRAVVLLLSLGLVLAGVAVAAMFRRTQPWQRTPPVRTIVAVGLAGIAALAIAAVDIFPGQLLDPARGGYIAGQQEEFLERYSIDSLYPLLDRSGAVGHRLAAAGLPFDDGGNRYVGLVLFGLVLWGALHPGALGRNRRRFWIVLGMGPVALWIATGVQPLGVALLGRWLATWHSPQLPDWIRWPVLASPVVALALLVVVVGRNVGPMRRRWPLALLLTLLGVVVLGCTNPLPWLQRALFFLRELRNPEWFSIAALPIAVAYPAALAADAWLGRLAPRPRLRWLAALVLTALAVTDFWPYRARLTDAQRDHQELAEIQQIGAAIAADPGDFRVIGADLKSKSTDTAYLYHHKRLAWDFRTYTAPRHTQTFLYRLYQRIEFAPDDDLALTLAGLANVKYVIDRRGHRRDLQPRDELELIAETERMAAFRNGRYRPWTRFYAEIQLLLGEGEGRAVDLAGTLAEVGIGLIETPLEPDPGVAALATRAYYDPTVHDAVDHPNVAALNVLPRLRRDHPQRRLSLTSARPSPEEIAVTIDTEVAGLVVVAESFHPWWTARLDGQPTPVYPGQYAFLGVPVPAGRHTLEFAFERPGGRWGWVAASLLAILCCIGYLLFGARPDPAGPFLLDAPAELPPEPPPAPPPARP